MGLKNRAQQLNLIRIANQDVESLKNYANGMKLLVNEINASWISGADKIAILSSMNECISEAVTLANRYATFSYNAERWLHEIDKLDKITKAMAVRAVIKIAPPDVWSSKNSRLSINTTELSGYADRMMALGNNLGNAHSGAVRVFAAMDSLIIGRFPAAYVSVHVKIAILQQKNARIAKNLKQVCQVYQKADNNVKAYINYGSNDNLAYSAGTAATIAHLQGMFGSYGVVTTCYSLSFLIEKAEEKLRETLKDDVRTSSNSYAKIYSKDGKIGAKAGVSIDKSAIAVSGAILTNWGEISGGAKIGNTGASADADIHIDKNSISASANAEAHTSAVELEGRIKCKYGEAEASGALMAAMAKAGVSGNISFKDGKFKGSAEAEASAEAVVAKGNMKAKVGGENLGAEGKAEGAVLGANANANAGVSFDENGNLKASAGAEANAYLAKGEVKGSINIFGIKIEAGVEGEIGLQAKAKGEVGSSSAAGSVGIGPLGASVKVDWSGLGKNVRKNISKIKLW